MIGNFLKETCEFYESEKITDISNEVKKLLLKFAFTCGKGSGMNLYRDIVYNKLENGDKIIESIEESVEECVGEKIDKPISSIITEIQKLLDIENKFFIYDINNESLNVFEADYNTIFKGKYRASKDFTKIIVSDNKENTNE